MSFAQRLLIFTITLANGQFEGGGNTLMLSNLRASCKISEMGGASSGVMQCAIFGMTPSQMNQLTCLPSFKSWGRNTITVQAGDGDGNGNPVGAMTTVFTGHLYASFMDGQGQPNVPFQIAASADGLQRVIPAPSTSVAGSGDVATMMGSLAATMGYSFENNNVFVKLLNHYSSGAPRMQAMEIAEAAAIQHIVSKGKLAIWPTGTARPGGPVMISPQTGMVGYPSFYATNIVVKTLFNPTLEFGQEIQIQSSIPAACGSWIGIKLDYELDSLMPKGRWFQEIQAYKKAAPQGTPQGPPP
jgi:hypothetical protein